MSVRKWELVLNHLNKNMPSFDYQAKYDFLIGVLIGELEV